MEEALLEIVCVMLRLMNGSEPSDPVFAACKAMLTQQGQLYFDKERGWRWKFTGRKEMVTVDQQSISIVR